MWNNPAVQKFIIAIGGFVALLIVVGLALPRQASVSASIRVDAPAATVFALVNDFHRVSLWSPWLNSDPNARIVYSGPERGVGAAMTWDGTIIGSGTQVITVSRPFEHVESVMNAGEPGEARSWFDIERANGDTRITWGFAADYGYNLIGRYFALLLAGVVQRDYAQGLERLKDLAESLPGADFSDLVVERLVVESAEIAYLSTRSVPEPAAISKAMGNAYFEILSFIDRHELTEGGAPLSITRSYSGSELLFDAAIPLRDVTDAARRDSAAVKIGRTYAGTVLRARHLGSYRTLGATHRKIAAYLAALGIERNGDAWESYVGDPTRVAEEDLLTDVYYPIRP